MKLETIDCRYIFMFLFWLMGKVNKFSLIILCFSHPLILQLKLDLFLRKTYFLFPVWFATLSVEFLIFCFISLNLHFWLLVHNDGYNNFHFVALLIKLFAMFSLIFFVLFLLFELNCGIIAFSF